jgi:NAD(P)-dependent dehydrogenase (short-subunit alcohol dehydrogenase family)
MARVLVTGANRGIGLAFVRAFQKRGDDVIATVRDPATADELTESGARIEELDVADDASVSLFQERLANTPIDLLINNAGIMRRDRIDTIDTASILRQFDINALGALRVTLAMHHNLKLAQQAARVVMMTSRMGSISDNTSGGYYGYRTSKAALNVIAKSLSIDLAPISVVALHPGYVRTRMTGNQGDLTAEDAVDQMLTNVIDRADRSLSGRFFHRDGHELPW